MIQTDHAAIAVRNLAQSQSFYERLGGITLSRPSKKFVEIELGDLRLHLVKMQKIDVRELVESELSEAGCPRIDHLCLKVGSMAEMKELKLRAEGHPACQRWALFSIIDSPPLGQFGESVEKTQPLKCMYLRDPDGISIEVRCYAE